MSISEEEVNHLDGFSHAEKARLKQTIRQGNELVAQFDDVINGKLPPKTHNYGVAGEQLRSIVQRIERLEEEKAALGVDIREVYAEAKGNGFDTCTIRKIIRLRKLDEHERREADMLLDVYKCALGMQADLFDAEVAAENEAAASAEAVA